MTTDDEGRTEKAQEAGSGTSEGDEWGSCPPTVARKWGSKHRHRQPDLQGETTWRGEPQLPEGYLGGRRHCGGFKIFLSLDFSWVFYDFYNSHVEICIWWGGGRERGFVCFEAERRSKGPRRAGSAQLGPAAQGPSADTASTAQRRAQAEAGPARLCRVDSVSPSGPVTGWAWDPTRGTKTTLTGQEAFIHQLSLVERLPRAGRHAGWGAEAGCWGSRQKALRGAQWGRRGKTEPGGTG